MMDKRGKTKENIILNNKGLSFVELIIAVVLLVVVLGPVMNTIIASSRVNMNSRKVMCATDAGQAVIESMSGKSYRGLLSSYKGVALNGGNELARFLDASGNDIYNNNVISYYKNTRTFGVSCSGTSLNSLNFNGTPVSTSNLAMGANDTTSYSILNAWGTSLRTESHYASGGKYLILWADCNNTKNINGELTDLANARCLFFAYSDVEWNGYHFDILGYVIPATTKAEAEFYPCSIRVAVYDHDTAANGTSQFMDTDTPLLVLDSGIRYK